MQRAEQACSALSWRSTVARRIVIDEWRARSVRPEKLMPDLPEHGGTDHPGASTYDCLMGEGGRRP